jgi:hypothetical protein
MLLPQQTPNFSHLFRTWYFCFNGEVLGEPLSTTNVSKLG